METPSTARQAIFEPSVELFGFFSTGSSNDSPPARPYSNLGRTFLSVILYRKFE